MRLFLVLDQLEELFSGTTKAERNAFLEVVESLAQSGCVWVLATVRVRVSSWATSVPASLARR